MIARAPAPSASVAWIVGIRPLLAFLIALLVACAIAVPRAPASAENPLEAIVSVTASIRDDGRTVPTLGPRRQGSGAVIDNDGLIVTIGFLILEADAVEVETHSGLAVPAEVLAYHAESGFGLLRAIAPLDATPIKLGSADSLREGDRVLIAGHGGVGSVVPASVSSRRSFAGAWEYLLPDAIFTVPAHPYAGGAALIADDGRLAGIGYLTVAQSVPRRGVVPGNMFVPIDHLKDVMADLIAEGRAAGPRRPWLGLYGREVEGRVFVERVARGGPADSAGVRAGDIVVKVGDTPVRDLTRLYQALWGMGEPGAVVPVTVLKDASLETLAVTSGDRYEWFRIGRRSF